MRRLLRQNGQSSPLMQPKQGSDIIHTSNNSLKCETHANGRSCIKYQVLIQWITQSREIRRIFPPKDHSREWTICKNNLSFSDQPSSFQLRCHMQLAPTQNLFQRQINDAESISRDILFFHRSHGRTKVLKCTFVTPLLWLLVHKYCLLGH
jgi:hypothetical protein